MIDGKYTVAEATELLGFKSNGTLSKIIKSGKIAYEVIKADSGHNRYVFTEDALMQYMEQLDEYHKNHGGRKSSCVNTPQKQDTETIVTDEIKGKEIGDDVFTTAYGKVLDKPYVSDTETPPIDKRWVFDDKKTYDRNIAIDKSCDLHITLDERVIAHKYIKGLSDEEFTVFIQRCLNDRLKRKY